MLRTGRFFDDYDSWLARVERDNRRELRTYVPHPTEDWGDPELSSGRGRPIIHDRGSCPTRPEEMDYQEASE